MERETMKEKTEVDYSSKDLVELPSRVLQECSIVTLYLDFNDIKYLPENIDCLVCLKHLSVIGNSLQSVPKSLGNIASLQELHLNDNCLTELPDAICNLKHLKKIFLTGNKLEKLPDEFGEITSLQVVNCDENCLHKLPKTFGLLKELVQLELGYNEIETISEGFGMLKSLQVLNLTKNKLQKLPKSFGDLPSLRILDLSYNSLESLPDRLLSGGCIERFYCDSNVLPTLPDWVSDMKSVVEFSVKDNQLHNQPLPDAFPDGCPLLKRLDMSGNFMAKIPDEFGTLSKLEFIHFGSVLEELDRRHFQNGNWIQRLPKSFCGLVNLTELHLDENQLSELPEDFGNLVSLEMLDLGQNYLHELPESFSRLQSLRICLLSKNHLMWLPCNIGDLTSLEDLQLDNNELAELPLSFCKLTQLKTLDLFSNRLTEIPSALDYLTNLVRLDIDGNEFKVPLTDVPIIALGNKYADRDPSLRDNWRGRPRQDISTLQCKIIKLGAGATITDFELPPKDLPFSSDFLMAAIRQNNSIWKSHNDNMSLPRRPFRRRRPKQHYKSDSDSGSSDDQEELSDSEEEKENDSGTDYDNKEDTDDNFEPPVFIEEKKWSGTRSPEAPTEGTHVSVCAMLEETESWDDEIEANITQNGPYDSPVVYCHPTKMYYPPEDNGAFTFAPFDMHEEAYVKQHRTYSTEDGQFENCVHDSSEELNIDPVF